MFYEDSSSCEYHQLMDAGWAHIAKDRPDFSEIVMALDDCLITTLFKDEHYASFWKKKIGEPGFYIKKEEWNLQKK